MHRSIIAGTLVSVACCAAPPAGAAPAEPPAQAGQSLDWKQLESPLLINHVQLTHRDKNGFAPGFVKAGEAYFDHQDPPRYVIFQAVAQPGEGQEPDLFYAMYVSEIRRDDSGRITGLADPLRVSPENSANTCGWFHPKLPWRVLFGSTVERPSSEQSAGFQVGSRKYVWMFPEEMDVVFRDIPPIHRLYGEKGEGDSVVQPRDWQGPVARIVNRVNYDAECSWSSDGRYVLYAHVRDEPTRGRPDADIWVYDVLKDQHHELVAADGYDGGPFFSPDGKRICYRSDRRGDDLLQLFVADLKFDEQGVPVGIEREHAITDDQSVNWAPYWHPSGKFLVYGTSAVGHSNYEVFAVEVDGDKSATERRKRRVTFATGADVLPVFSDDGKLMLWTAQRGPMIAGETRPSSQLWVAEVNPATGGFSDPAHLFDNLPEQRPEGAPAASPPAQTEHK